MSERLTFTLSGRDDLSRVLGHAGDSADRLRRQMVDAADGSGQALLTLTRDANGFLRDLEGRYLDAGDAAALMAHGTDQAARATTEWSQAADDGARAGEALKKSLISLAPAAIPAAASIAPIAPAVLAGAVAAGVYGLAIGKQIAALGEAVKAEQKYQDAVEESGEHSDAAIKAQATYVKQMAKLPPATREAAAALSVFTEEFDEWSDSVAADTMTPVTKGLGVMQAILPKLTPMVKTFGHELDRTVTLAGGGVSSPGFDAFAGRFERFTSDVLERGNDRLVHFLRTADTDQVGDGLSEFMAFAREQGPVVGDILRNLGEALVNVLEGATDTGVGMLTLVGALAKLVASVPPEVIAVLLQLAIAIKLVGLAAAGLAAARTVVAAFITQVVVMQTAAAGATTRMGALTASFGAMSRGAKMALVGSGIGLLVILLSELSSASKGAPADLDKMTSSLGQFSRTGELSGEAARILGSDFGELETSLRTLSRPSNYESAIQWIGDLVGIDSAPVGVAKEQIGALDGALAQMVRNGNPEMAEAAIRKVAAGMEHLTEDELRTQLTGYKETLADVAFEQELAAEAMGLFGQQALQTKQKLDAQKASADGLRQAIFALNETNRSAIGAMSGFEASIDGATKAATENGRTLKVVNGELDLGSEKARNNEAALRDLAGKTEAAAAAALEQGKSQEYANGILDRGRNELIKVAMQMGLNRNEAKRLADQILKTPDKTARLRGNLEDLEAKLRTAKDKLSKVPDGRKAAIRAQISQLEDQVNRAKGLLKGIPDEQVGVSVYLKATPYDTNANGVPDMIEARAQGGLVGFPGGGPVRGPGTSTSDSILTRLSNGEYVVRATAVQQYGIAFLDDVNQGRLGTAEAPRPRTPARMPAPGRAAGPTVRTTVVNNNVTVNGAVDLVGTAKSVERVLLKLQRTSGN
ncbi:hypothetical protein [Streptomyces sp. NPDC001774]